MLNTETPPAFGEKANGVNNRYCESSTPTDYPETALLDMIPQNFRGTIGDLFYKAYRAGIFDTDEIIASVLGKVERWKQKATTPARSCEYAQIIEAVSLNFEATREFVAKVKAREVLPAEQRTAQKREAAAEYVAAAMRGKEVTSSQLACLNRNGYKGPFPKDWAEASRLISDLLNRRGAAL